MNATPSIRRVLPEDGAQLLVYIRRNLKPDFLVDGLENWINKPAHMQSRPRTAVNFHTETCKQIIVYDNEAFVGENYSNRSFRHSGHALSCHDLQAALHFTNQLRIKLQNFCFIFQGLIHFGLTPLHVVRIRNIKWIHGGENLESGHLNKQERDQIQITDSGITSTANNNKYVLLM